MQNIEPPANVYRHIFPVSNGLIVKVESEERARGSLNILENCEGVDTISMRWCITTFAVLMAVVTGADPALSCVGW